MQLSERQKKKKNRCIQDEYEEVKRAVGGKKVR